jgi:hypothetical protein
MQTHSHLSNLYSSVTLASGRNPSSPNDTFHAARYSIEGRAGPNAGLPPGSAILPDGTSYAQLQTSAFQQQNPSESDGFLQEEINAFHSDLNQARQNLQHRRQSRLGREVSSAEAQISRNLWVDGVRSALEAFNQNLRESFPELSNMPAPAPSSQATQQHQSYHHFRGQGGPSSRAGEGSMPVPTSSVTASYSDPAMPSQWNRSGDSNSRRSTRAQEEQGEESTRYHRPPAPWFNNVGYPQPIMPTNDVYVLVRRVLADLGQQFRDDLNR